MQVAFRNGLLYINVQRSMTLYAIHGVQFELDLIGFIYLGRSHFGVEFWVDNGISSGRLGFQFKKLYYECHLCMCVCVFCFAALVYFFFLFKKENKQKKRKVT